MSINLVLAAIVLFLTYGLLITDRRVLKWINVLTEHVGTVAFHTISPARVEEEWVQSYQTFDLVSTPWMSTEPPMKIQYKIPETPCICIRLANGIIIMHECHAGEYEAWADGTKVRVDVYTIGGWRFHVSEPRLLA